MKATRTGIEASDLYLSDVVTGWQRYPSCFAQVALLAASLVLAATSIVCLVVITLIRPKSDKKK